ncbi:major facilitator superfamily domain-containing protein [Elsinoe ampelina]|uniref:Major facilitator superfamily domain-containing protein n=1 Tax=Elsinoe ampelina TaxID=302913 RepID=A0A6A6G5G5_9PEZI|nr:major facilitator superfamily domain-containing protein [Elsinoe ampelina]
MTGVTKQRASEEVTQVNTLGHLRLRHELTNEIILIPTPSNDPNDPLNWSKRHRVYIALLVSLAMFFCNFLAAGPSVAIVNIVIDYFGTPPMTPGFPAAIAKTAYLFTTTALLQGMGNLIWMPFIIKYGRRPMYIISFTGYAVCALWSGLSKSYESELASRIILGFFAGSAECIAPLTISDIFFLHERGFYMGMYTVALSLGVSGGVIISGLITINLSWRYIYYVAAALIGALTILVFFTLPETDFKRDPTTRTIRNIESKEVEITEHVEGLPDTNPRQSFVQRLRVFHGPFTNESLWRIFYRPIVLLALPPVLWATLIMSVTIGFLVAISSNFASAFAQVYGFKPYQSGLCFISGFIGTLFGIFGGGQVSDWVADYFTRRNGGIREPEMRLPAMTLGLICTPVGLVLYGVGIEKQLHWIVATLGLGFLSFAIAQTTNVSLVYIIDSYRPIAGETVVTQLAFKSAFGFLLSFYTNPWIEKAGYANAFGAMAGIAGGVILLWVPFYIWGRQIRVATLKWRVMTNLAGWDEDREVGE